MENFKRQGGDYDGLKDDPEGDMMWYHDHVEVVKGLEARITTLETLLSESEANADCWENRYYGYD